MIERLTALNALEAINYAQVAVAGTPVGLPAVAATADAVELYLEGGPIRYRVDGGDPSSTDGIPMYVGSFRLLSRKEAQKFKAIRQGGAETDGTLHHHDYIVV